MGSPSLRTQSGQPLKSDSIRKSTISDRNYNPFFQLNLYFDNDSGSDIFRSQKVEKEEDED